MNISIYRNREINEYELQSINGGAPTFIVDPVSTDEHYVYIHDKCNGEIENVGNPFKNCRCRKCGEEHYSCLFFDYTEVKKKAPKS